MKRQAAARTTTTRKKAPAKGSARGTAQAGTIAAEAAEVAAGGMRKQYVKSRGVCKVTFRLPAEAVGKAGRVNLVGDFNGWSTEATPLKRHKNGEFTVDVELDVDREYRFRYLIDGVRWENDWSADRYAPNRFGGDDSVVAV